MSIYCSYRSGTPPRRGKQILALETSSLLLVWVGGRFWVVVSFQPLLYLQSHHMFCMDRQLWYHCPSLPERTAGWHISTQTYPYSGCQCHPLLALQSHGPLFGVLLWPFDEKKKLGVLASELKTMFISFWEWKWWFHHTSLAYERWITMSLSETILHLIVWQRENANSCSYYLFFFLNFRWWWCDTELNFRRTVNKFSQIF